jgi:hypothetical protein
MRMKVAHSFDDLAMGLDTGATTRGKAMKLADATLVAYVLGAVGLRERGALPTFGTTEDLLACWILT